MKWPPSAGEMKVTPGVIYLPRLSLRLNIHTREHFERFSAKVPVKVTRMKPPNSTRREIRGSGSNAALAYLSCVVVFLVASRSKGTPPRRPLAAAWARS